MEEFDIRAPLPTGTVLLEASAGTGKTWTIAALVARYVAEGEATLDQLLVVTFGRAASQELRERVRERLVALEGVLSDLVLTGSTTRERDDLVDLVVAVDETELRRRRGLVRDALTSFDSAAIVTIHQFCHMVLKGLGVAGDTDAGATLVEDLDDLLVEVVDDLYLRDHADATSAQAFPRKEALTLGREAVRDPRARLEPADAPEDSIAGIRVAFAGKVRTEFDLRKRRLGVLSYDDLLGQLADALEDSDAPARSRMRQRWSVVLVDEFQDTDPVQWQVFDRAFSGVATMVLIGDPKQAIYAFRGGDVFTYLQAKQSADVHQTLGVNRRSDAGLLAQVQVVLEGAELGSPEIVVLPVEASQPASRLAAPGAPFTVRVLTREDLGAPPNKLATVGGVNQRIAADAAAQVKQLLTCGATFVDETGERELTAGDIAVLAYRRAHLDQVREALAEVGVPAVIAGGGSVFDTPAAAEWRSLLEALEQPHRSARVRAAAVTSFYGYTVADLVDGGDTLTEQLSDRLRDVAALLGERGVAAVFETAVARDGLNARVLGRVGGERHLTDLRHVAESLHDVASRERLGLVALLAWMREQMSEELTQTATERTRRLDSDAHAVQLVTVHGSKGLEYPVVLLPFVSDRYGGRKAEVLAYHDETGERVVHVGGSDGRPAALDNQTKAEDDGESLRLLYVAMTRAKSRLIAWWAAGNNVPTSPLNRLLLGRKPGDGGSAPRVEPGPDAEVVRWLRAWEGRRGPAVQQALAVDVDPAPLPADERELAVRTFSRVVDTAWRRTSYSSLSAAGAAHAEPAVGSEPESAPRDDEEMGPDAVIAEPLDDAALRSPMADLPVGATFGSLVHAVLEHTDPAAPDHDGDLRSAISAEIAEQLLAWPQDVDAEALADALLAVYASPLGPLVGEATLGTIAMADRLCELDFEMPLAGGDLARTTRADVRLADVGPLLLAHLPEGDPVRGYAEALRDPALGYQPLVGYLTGSIDVVLRIGDRFLVVDYKTNWLGPREAELTALAYAPDALDGAMGHSDYPLQALLYAVVLHRFLRWRLPGYDPSEHIGGVLYLYLRGMCGPETPTFRHRGQDGNPAGIFSWQPPVALVLALSDLLDGVTEVRSA
ncbi:exodeoxyribonuclease V subunit beta [Nocardioides marmorisolisilvae]|uniref:RecBCD enzyme subunit RecB n=1 Tax=Nocardioides marmorisolisilvae TaxID=1542737 RepID=A0A3N0DJB9_9ACTN|nr:exodeoxyribonuclease V subunit beta [Nocardioides marmorisolisilvae]